MDDRFRRDQTASNDCQVESQLIHITASPPQRDMSQLDVDIAALQGAATHDLRIAWRRLCRGEPPPCMTRELMIRALAYRMQERAHGGLAPATKRRLQGLVAEIEAKDIEAFDPGVVLKPGAR